MDPNHAQIVIDWTQNGLDFIVGVIVWAVCLYFIWKICRAKGRRVWPAVVLSCFFSPMLILLVVASMPASSRLLSSSGGPSAS